MNEYLDNETLLREVKRRLDTHTLDAAAVRALVGAPEVVPESVGMFSHFSLTKLLYIIGGVVATLGIIFFIGQIWEDIGSLGRIMVTFGLGVLLAWYGTTFMRQRAETLLGDVLHAIAGLLLPGGALVILSELRSDVTTAWPVIGVFTAVSIFYFLLLRLFSRSILVFYAIANTTIAVTLLFAELFPRASDQVYLLFSMTVGLVYVYLAYAYRAEWNRYLVSLLNLVGSATFYIAAFLSIFEGQIFWNTGHSLFWEFVFPFLALGGMFGAIWARSRSVLLVATIALIAYIIYITSEYFADSIGWPLALVILGFVIIGIGYASINLGKKYITTT